MNFFVHFVKANSNSLGGALARVTPHTVATVVRWHTASATVLEAATGSGVPAVNVQGNSANTGMRTYSGTALTVAATIGSPWHVYLSVFNGTSSVSRLDNLTEVTGDAGSGLGSVLSLGAFGTTFSNCDIKKVIYWPFAMTSTDRTTQVASLKTEYGF
ncbi:hypothetical protein [Subtercola endophyticus]|uniref:hypothetical protein n=1 Tax=Subtercola endophyticus TaxID=2895559 RepID=UPI001E33843C|nr:hypothetical protein [Subtercola endophyticus]UFS59460.1 hypothetical protein LQ955_01275 [Subtercola endophyticus]